MLKVHSLHFSYGDVKIINDISFELAPGELLHLKGANGVGKSTLLAVLAGIITPQSGEISPVSTAYLSAEANGLYMQMNAYSNLRFWAGLAGEPAADENNKHTIEDTLAWWGLSHKTLQHGLPVAHLSTGMRRRLALARISLSQASCWLLDEPIYGLDIKGVALFRQCLMHHCSQGGMSVVVSHDLASLQDLPLRTLELKNL